MTHLKITKLGNTLPNISVSLFFCRLKVHKQLNFKFYFATFTSKHACHAMSKQLQKGYCLNKGKSRFENFKLVNGQNWLMWLANYFSNLKFLVSFKYYWGFARIVVLCLELYFVGKSFKLEHKDFMSRKVLLFTKFLL